MSAVGTIDAHDILLTGRDRLLTISSVQTLESEQKIKGENRKFNLPIPGALHLEEYLAIFSEPHVASGLVEINGRFEYVVVVPSGVGTKEAEALRTEIANAFRPDEPFTGKVNLSIDRVERGTGSTGDDGIWYRLPIFIFWRAYSSLYST